MLIYMKEEQVSNSRKAVNKEKVYKRFLDKYVLLRLSRNIRNQKLSKL